VILALFHMRRARHLLAADFVLGVGLLALSLGLFCLPAIDHHSVGRLLTRKLRDVAPGDAELLTLGYNEPSLVFYAEQPVHVFHTWWQLYAHLSENPNAVCIAIAEKRDDLPPGIARKLRVVGDVRAFLPSQGAWQEWTFYLPRPAEREMPLAIPEHLEKAPWTSLPATPPMR